MPNKNVLAILSGVVALGLAALAVGHARGGPLPSSGRRSPPSAPSSWGVDDPARRTALVLMAIAAGSGRSSSTSTTSGGCSPARFVFVWAAFGLLPLMDGAWRLKAGFVVAVFLGAASPSGRPAATASSSGKIPLPAYVGRSHRLRLSAARHRPRPRPQRRPAARLHGRGRRGDPRQARPLRRRDAPGARDGLRAPHAARGASRARSSRSSTTKVHVAQPESGAHPPQVHGQGRQVARSTTASTRSSSASSPRRRARATTRSPSRSARRSSRRSASARSRRPRTRSPAASTSSASARPPSRRATRTSSSRSRAATRRASTTSRRPSARRPASSSRWSTTRGATRSSARAQGRRASRRRGHRAVTEETAPDGLDANGHKKSVKALLRAHVVPAAEVPERVDDRLPRALQDLDAGRSTSRTTTSSASRRSPSRSTDTEPLQFKQVGWRTLYLFARAEVTGDYITDAQHPARTSRTSASTTSRLTFSPAGADRFEEVTGRERQPPLRHHPRRRRRLGARHQARRSAAAARSITMGAGDPEKQLHDAKQLELVLRSGALPGAHHAEQRVAHRPVARAGRDPRGREGRRSSASSRVLALHGPLLPEVGRRGRRRGALQPDAADGGARELRARR